MFIIEFEYNKKQREGGKRKAKSDVLEELQHRQWRYMDTFMDRFEAMEEENRGMIERIETSNNMILKLDELLK